MPYTRVVRVLGWLATEAPPGCRPGGRGDGATSRGRDTASSGRPATIVLAGPGRALGFGPGPAASAVAASHRHPGHAAVLAPAAAPTSLDVSDPARPAPHQR